MQTLLFWISKIINPLLSPLMVSIVFIIIALIAFKRLLKKSRQTVISESEYAVYRVIFLSASIALGILYVVSTPIISNQLVRFWEPERTDPHVLISEAVENNKGNQVALIVLGGIVSVELSTENHSEMGTTAERLTAPAKLYHMLREKGLDPVIIVTSGSGNPTLQQKAEAPLMAELLELMMVPKESILLEADSRNTYENALFTYQLLKGRTFDTTILVTSALHMRRSAAIFRKAGFIFEPYTVDTALTTPPLFNSFFADTSALDISFRTYREIIGYIAYKMLKRL